VSEWNRFISNYIFYTCTCTASIQNKNGRLPLTPFQNHLNLLLSLSSPPSQPTVGAPEASERHHRQRRQIRRWRVPIRCWRAQIRQCCVWRQAIPRSAVLRATAGRNRCPRGSARPEGATADRGEATSRSSVAASTTAGDGRGTSVVSAALMAAREQTLYQGVSTAARVQVAPRSSTGRDPRL